MPPALLLASPDRMLRALCGSVTRVRVLRVLFGRALEPLSLAELARSAGSDPANVLRLLRTFVDGGLVEVVAAGRPAPRYRPRRDSAHFAQLRALFASDPFPPAGGSSHLRLDEHKRRLGELILERYTLKRIRARSLKNLARWRARGTWNPAYEEWQGILLHGTGRHLVEAMTGPGEEPNRLRQSMPYVGLLDRKTVQGLNEEIAA